MVPLNHGGYHSFSLLNSERKICAINFAPRLDESLPKLIHIDQISFLSFRQIADNMRKLFHVIHYSSQTVEPTTVVSLDTKKLFDCIERSNLFKPLNKFRFGLNFLNLISLMY